MAEDFRMGNGVYGSITCLYEENIQTLSATWVIPEYDMLEDTIISPAFGDSGSKPIGGDAYQHLWHLTLHPNGSRRAFKSFMSIYLYSNSTHLKPTVRMTIKLARMYGKMESGFQQSHEAKKFEEGSGGFGFHKFIPHEYLLDEDSHFLSTDKSLVVTVTIKHLDPEKDDIDLNALVLFSEQMYQFFEESDEQFTDVTFEVEGKELKASKGILAARSSVFHAMFKSGMSEAATNSVVRIEDVEYNVMRTIIRYIYSGSVREEVHDPSDNSHFVIKLFCAADKYALHYLKAVCENYILSTLSKKNVVFALMAGDLHNSSRIKEACFAFSQGKAIKNFDDWEIITRDLMVEMIDYWSTKFPQDTNRDEEIGLAAK